MIMERIVITDNSGIYEISKEVPVVGWGTSSSFEGMHIFFEILHVMYI